jgi:hypothetical protein
MKKKTLGQSTWRCWWCHADGSRCLRGVSGGSGYCPLHEKAASLGCHSDQSIKAYNKAHPKAKI